MKKVISFAVCLILLINVNAQDVKDVSSKIDNVTVFLQGAQIERSASVKLVAGENQIRFSGVTGFLDPKSIQVKGSDDFVISGVKHQMNYLAPIEPGSVLQIKQDSLESVQFQLNTRRALRTVYNEEIAFLQANRAIGGKNEVLLVEDIEETANFYRERFRELQFKLIELQQEESDLQNTVYRLQREINQFSANRNKPTSEIIISMVSNKAKVQKIVFSYFSNQAGWFPLYDVRANDADKKVEMTYKGKVYQNTGNDWEDVKLTLSSGDPTIGGTAPIMRPWNIRLQDPMVYDRKAKSRSYAYETPVMYDQADAEEPIMEMSAVEVFGNAAPMQQQDLVNTVSTLITTEFKINLPYSIPSDNQRYEVETKRFDLKGDFEHFAIPKLREEVYLTATVTDWMKHNLIQGEANVYYQGTFVGSTFIQPEITNDTLRLSLGQDPAVVVNREQISDLCKTKTLGSKKTTTKAFKIAVQNTKSQSVKLLLEDQIPVSQDGDLEVNTIELSNGRLDSESGKVVWELNLAPGESKELMLTFELKHPKNKILQNY